MRYLFEPLRVLEKKEILNNYTQGYDVFPESVEIDPANSCNHDCPFCIYSSLHQKGRREQLTRGVLSKTIDELCNLGCSSILFIGGGEPLSNKHTADMIEFAASKKFSVGLVTNGSLLNEKTIVQIGNNATYVRISLDAGTPETHLLMHRSQDFKKIVSNLNKIAIQNNSCTVGVSFFVNEYNYKDIPLASKIALENGADYIQFKGYAGISINEGLHIEITKQLKLALQDSNQDFDVHIMEGLLQNSFYQVRDYSKCHWQNFKTIIGADGNVYVCTQKRGNKNSIIGNINTHSLQEIWSSEQRKVVVGNIVLKNCPYCVHHKQNSLLEYLYNFNESHKDFY